MHQGLYNKESTLFNSEYEAQSRLDKFELSGIHQKSNSIDTAGVDQHILFSNGKEPRPE